MPKANSKRGFTIIEVVLVLAIAGLIFLMVFIALPAMQRSQRDTQRRDQLSMMMTQITQYQANNRNKLPEDKIPSGKVLEINPEELTDGDNVAWIGWGGFYKNYLLAQNDSFDDPNGNPYKLYIQTCTKGENDECSNGQRTYSYFTGDENDARAQNYKISVLYNAVCDGEKAVYNSGSREVAILYKLEGGGTYCSNN